MEDVIRATEVFGSSSASDELLITNYHLLGVAGGLGAEMVARELDIMKVQTMETIENKARAQKKFRRIKKRSVNTYDISYAPSSPASPLWTWTLPDGTCIKYISRASPALEGVVPFWRRAVRASARAPLIINPASRR